MPNSNKLLAGFPNAVRNTDTSGSTVNGLTQIQYGTVDYDPGSLYSGGIWSVGIPGSYNIAARLELSDAIPVNISIYKNGAQYSSIDGMNGLAAITDTLLLMTGDYIEIFANTGTSTTLIPNAGYNSFNMAWTGQ